MTERILRKWSREAEKPPLPFKIHGDGICDAGFGERSAALGRYDWTPKEVGVAKAALLNDYRVAVAVSPSHIAWALTQIFRSLACPVGVGYQVEHERLVIWPMRTDDDEPTLEWEPEPLE
ncbi:MAG: hypothetical protein KJ749_11785 [Planctomycetes bacterium]|nr:hypothetical protein [Planctomycetota bacterium]